MTDFISCQDLVELITEYLEDALPSERRAAFEEHIAICPPCRGYLVEIRRTVAAAGLLSEDDLPLHVREQMLAVFRDWNSGSP
ncbi:MAG: anti-sigma factor family protein [Gaiella sp.]